MNVLVCDLDKTLLPYGGIKLEEQLCQKMIELQKNGMRIILASARISGGVLPVARQLQLQKYQGFVIADNGSFLYDMEKASLWKGYDISMDICNQILQFAHEHNLHVSFEQQSYAVASAYDAALEMDRKNCGIDYILTENIHRYIQNPIYKCSITQTKEVIDHSYQELCRLLKDDYAVFRSTDTFVDIIRKGRSKEQALIELMEYIQIPLHKVIAVGDGDSDAQMIRLAGLGVTLENGSPLCKRYAKRIYPSCYEEGCLHLINELLQMQKEKL